jgi:dUTP pyrophosphatase
MRLVVPIKYKILHKKAVVPEPQTPGAACVDLVATEIEYIDENKVIVKYGFGAEIPEGYKVYLTPRSSFCHKGWVMQNSHGIVDSDYRGEWMTKFEAIPQGIKLDKSTGLPLGLVYEDFPYQVGDRVVQASVEVNIHMKFKESEELSTTLRGEGGFGSTGR